MYDVIFTITPKFLYGRDPVRELAQFHNVITITAEDVLLETWNTQEDWEHVSS